MELILLLCVPIVWVVISKWIWPHKITMVECALHTGVALFCIVAVYLAFTLTALYDHGYYHGQVTSKYSERVHCRHSYPCRCRTVCRGSGSHRSCSTHCDTCYSHAYDIDWILKSTIGSIYVNTIDWQGLRTPPLWEAAQTNDPVTKTYMFQNFLKVSDRSLYHKEGDYKLAQPGIYDEFKYNPVIWDKTTVLSNHRQISAEVMDVAKNSAANILVVISSSADMNTYAEKVLKAWEGLKLHDVLVIVKLDGSVITWARVFTYASNKDNELTSVVMRDNLLGVDLSIQGKLYDALGKAIVSYTKPNEDDFKYLYKEVKLSVLGFWVISILMLLINIGLTWFMVNNNENENERW